MPCRNKSFFTIVTEFDSFLTFTLTIPGLLVIILISCTLFCASALLATAYMYLCDARISSWNFFLVFLQFSTIPKHPSLHFLLAVRARLSRISWPPSNGLTYTHTGGVMQAVPILSNYPIIKSNIGGSGRQWMLPASKAIIRLLIGEKESSPVVLSKVRVIFFSTERNSACHRCSKVKTTLVLSFTDTTPLYKNSHSRKLTTDL